MIAINFSSRNYRLISRVVQSFIAGSLVLAVVAAAIIGHAVSQRTSLREMQVKLKEAEASNEQAKPLLAERDKLVRDLGAMSGLLDARQFSWTRLLSSMESVVPVGVALTKVDFDRKDGTLTLDGKAQSPESLRNLVVGLERSPSFRDPRLKHQSIEKGIISFNVVAVYHERKDNDLAQGKR